MYEFLRVIPAHLGVQFSTFALVGLYASIVATSFTCRPTGILQRYRVKLLLTFILLNLVVSALELLKILVSGSLRDVLSIASYLAISTSYIYLVRFADAGLGTFKSLRPLYAIVIGIALIQLIFMAGPELFKARNFLSTLACMVFLAIAIKIRLAQFNSLGKQSRRSVYVWVFVLILLFAHQLSIETLETSFQAVLMGFAVITLLFASMFIEVVQNHNSVAKPKAVGPNEHESESTDHPEPSQGTVQKAFNSELQASQGDILALVDSQKTTDKLLIRYFKWVTEHYKDPDVTIDRAVKAIGTSQATLNRRLKAENLPTSKRVLSQYRLEMARKLLKTHPSSVAANLCGFRGHSHFSQVFKDQYGLTPSRYREEMDLNDF